MMPVKSDKAQLAFARLIEIMARLRAPDGGCPWDRDQTFDTIAPYTIEEAYEVADAIERKSLSDLKEELGDLLFQVVFHARMAEETDAFAIDDVVEAICDKMIRRHPHVFASGAANDTTAVRQAWDEIKEAERKAKRRGKPARLLDDVPSALPALSRAIKLQNRAARVGFDWPHIRHVYEKLQEEIGELVEAAESGDDQAHIQEEIGDILFVCANLARHLDVDPEAALRGANAKFIRRFDAIEEALARQGLTAEDVTLEEMDALWNEAKKREKRS